ncbi:MAG TPA: SufD family Fe-S cluster assembly protein [Candidatus Acidoferrum sp.]|nr:SufD family Fe-S cluster assembly protein [Candidatus Acidoferrum sp.]
MDPYRLFAEDAIQKYKDLPEEQNELYKRKYVGVGPEALVEIFRRADPTPKDTAESIDAISKTLFSNTIVKFDVIISGDDYIIGPNAKYVTVLSPFDVKIALLEKKLFKSSEDKLAALIHAFTRKMVFIDIPKGAKSNINILFLNANSPLAVQVMINCAEESELQMMEWYASASSRPSASCVMHEAQLHPYSKASIDAVHNEDKGTIAVGLSKYKVGNSANLRINYLYNGGSHTRAKNRFDAVDHEASLHVNELIFGSSSQKFDISSYIENGAPSTTAELHTKAALMNESQCMMKGFAKIPFGSRGARSFVHETGMLLDKSAYLDSIPAMSIDENEVKATHSSATGPIDDELIFYLMSKGLDETKAKKLLVEGFFSSAVTRFKSDSAKLAAASLIADKINTSAFGGKLKISAENIWVGRANEEDIFKDHYKYR